MTLPYFLKIKVLKEYLTGLKREEIARNNGISTGSVSMIMDEFRKALSDLDKLREMAIQINNTGYDINHFFAAIRHNNHLKKLGLTEEKAEEIIETMHECSFKNEMTIQQFFECITYVLKAEIEIGKSIKELPRDIKIKEAKLETLQLKIIQKEKNYEDKCHYYNVKDKELKEFVEVKSLKEELKMVNEELWLEKQYYKDLLKENDRIRKDNEGKDNIIKNLTMENNFLRANHNDNNDNTLINSNF